MKIIGVDNYDREYISDFLVCENVNKGYGNELVNYLNKQDDQPRFYKLVEDDYKLYVFEP